MWGRKGVGIWRHLMVRMIEWMKKNFQSKRQSRHKCIHVFIYKHCLRCLVKDVLHGNCVNSGRGSYRWLWRSLSWWHPPLCPSGSWFLWQSSQTQTHPRGRSTQSAWLCLQPLRRACCSRVHSPDPGENRGSDGHSFTYWSTISTQNYILYFISLWKWYSISNC